MVIIWSFSVLVSCRIQVSNSSTTLGWHACVEYAYAYKKRLYYHCNFFPVLYFDLKCKSFSPLINFSYVE